MRVLKYIIKTIIVILFLAFGITAGFSDSENSEAVNPEFNNSFSRNLSNAISDVDDINHIDTFVNDFISKHCINGMGIAISKNGKLVYAKGYGYANKEKGEMVQPGHMFRIASSSKLITAIAVMKLIEDGKLHQNDYVFGKNGILNHFDVSDVCDSNYYNIKVDHLLKHTGGWEKMNGDPMFMPLYIAYKMNVEAPPDIETIAKYVFSKPLDYKPGKVYSYSNFGYALLGKIIETVSGIPYEDYVKIKILHPLDIYDMGVGKSFYHEKMENEVKYYEEQNQYRTPVFSGTGQYVPAAYGGNYIENLAATGGWIASAPELLKLVAAIDGDGNVPDILNKESIKYMTNPKTCTDGPVGWYNSDGYGMWWRPGAFAGASSLILKQRNNISWAIVSNTTFYNNVYLHNQMSQLMFKVIGQIYTWPEHDLFDYQYPEIVAYR